MGAQTRVWREVWDSITRRSRWACAERRIHESDARPQNSQRRHREFVDWPGRHTRDAAANGAGDVDCRERWEILLNAARASGAVAGPTSFECVRAARKAFARCFGGD